jgi:hypothetical protein
VENDEETLDLIRKISTLKAKLTVRDCQYQVALEGLETIKNSNDPMGIAKKTIDAILDCLPD